MCGIAGIYAYRDPAPPVDRDELLRIREQMARRGPDGAGLWLSDDSRVGLAHRRLAIIDLSDAGAQPMASADGRYRITFNGEIYNYRELRRELEGRGFVFRTRSDTEVLLHLYADRGERMVDALRGMFAFGIRDEAKQGMFLARDPFGIKPLYYADDGATLRFASQVKALLAGGAIDTAEDPAGHVSFLLLGSVADPFTLYKSIAALPAGSSLWVDAQGVGKPRPYFRIADEFAAAEASPRELNEAEMVACLGDALRASVRRHMVADVPVGVFLSSGIDSCTLLGLASEEGARNLQTMTLAFREYRNTANDEAPLAEEMARRFGASHQTRWVGRNDFQQHLDALLDAMDQPSIDGVNSYFVAKVAAEAGMKVALSGLGGDEILGGYPSFRDIPRIRTWLGWGRSLPGLGRAVRRATAPVLGRLTSPKFAGLLEYGGTHSGAYLLRRGLYMPWELADLMGSDRARAGLDALRLLPRLDETRSGLKGERTTVAALELEWYMRCQLLRDADWAGMAHSLEVRVPFVDVDLFRTLAPMLASRRPPQKRHLGRIANPPLPADIQQRSKTGFTTPAREWSNELRPGRRPERGIRGWARVVGGLEGGRRFLAFVTDAYGGHGGIALYNRDLLQSLCSFPGCARVIAIPRKMPNPPEPMPEKLVYVDRAVGSKLRYLAVVCRLLGGDRRHDLVVCGHINLMPLAWLASRFLGVPLVLFIYGIDAWQPSRSRIANALARRIRWVVSISEVTATRFRTWVPATAQQLRVLPNAIHTEWYGPGGKSAALLARYGLEGKAVLMTLGRLVSAERYKGFDETLEALPDLVAAVPNVAYLVVGDGSDRGRLEQKARTLGVADRVVFAGNVPEAEKADHYRLADAYVMPSQGEGFGFVLLEAMACGIPVIASMLDGGREAARDGQLGRLVDPTDRMQLQRAILEALGEPKGVVPAGLEHFSFCNFEARAHALFGQILDTPQPLGST